MKNSFRRCIGLLTFLGLVSIGSSAAAEGRVHAVRVTEIAQGSGNMAWVHFSTNIGHGRPSCISNGWENEFSFDVSTSRGKAILSLLTTSLLSGRPVEVFGSHSCNNVNGKSVENIGYAKLYH